MRPPTLAVILALYACSPALAQTKSRPPFDPDDRPAPRKRYSLASSERPLVVWFLRKADATTARRVIGLLESAWRLQVDRLGFRPPTPYDPSGAGRYHVFLERGLGTEVTSAQRAPGAAWDAWETYMTVDAWGEYGGAILGETIVHEFNHALQASDDWWESPGFFEMCATWVQEKHFPERDDYLNHIVDFQRRPDLPPDHDDGYETWFMYGASLYLVFLEQRYFQGDARWLGRVWRGSRNAPRPLTDDEAPDPRGNEADWIDALEAELPSGVSYADTVVAFARWRWYTGRRSDGRHFHDGAKLGERGEVPLTATIAAPRELTSPGPRLLGTHYVQLERPADGRPLEIELDGDPRARWVVQAVPGLTPGSDGERIADGVVRFGALARRTLVLTAVPLQPGEGRYDPEEHLTAQLGYTLRVGPADAVDASGAATEAIAPVDSGGLVGGLSGQ